VNISRTLAKGHTYTLLLVIAAGAFFNWTLNGPFTVFSVIALAIMVDLTATLIGHSMGRTAAWHSIGAGEDYGRLSHRRDVARARVDINKHLTESESEELGRIEAKIEAAYKAAENSHDATPTTGT
jgi:multisubunit Na+/H+ antiporter MnhG subunit